MSETIDTDGGIEVPDTWHKEWEDLNESERECLIERKERDRFEVVEEPYDADTHLDEPIKVRWTGYARDRISEYNSQFQSIDSDRFQKAVNRQKTNVVMETVEEATAVAKEMGNYSAGMNRAWMNSSMDRALSRVQSEIIDAMADRGYEVERDRVVGNVVGFGVRAHRSQ